MISYTELRYTSLDFRRKSSDLLNSTYENASIQLQRFKRYIDDTQIIKEIIQRKVDNVAFDYRQCFVGNSLNGWRKLQIPVDEASHIKAMYDYMEYLIASGESIMQIALSYSHETKITEAIRDFYCDAFKPLIDFVVDELSKEMILEEEQKLTGTSFTQNIGTVYGSANQQLTGSITANTYVSPEAVELSNLIDEFLIFLNSLENIDIDLVEDARDDLEAIAEQLVAESPKKRRLEKAIEGIKSFAQQVSTQVAVSTASATLENLDWNLLIEKIQMFINTL